MPGMESGREKIEDQEKAPDRDLAGFATVTVTYNPDLAILRRQLNALPRQASKILVDNASVRGTIQELQSLVAQIPNAHLLLNADNVGLAAALNQGVRAASQLQPSVRFALLLDQDTEPLPHSIAELLAAFRTLEARGEVPGCVGPALRDVTTGLEHGFHQCTRWRWVRYFPSAGSAEPVRCANINGSGTLVPVALFLSLGGLDEGLFIDHVDTEWAFRVQAAGYSLWGIPQAVFAHRMGEDTVRFWWFGWRIWPARLPRRHYFLFRNAVTLMRRPYVPSVWKAWAVAKLLMTAIVVLLTGPQRLQQLLSISRGVSASLSRAGASP